MLQETSNRFFVFGETRIKAASIVAYGIEASDDECCDEDTMQLFVCLDQDTEFDFREDTATFDIYEKLAELDQNFLS